MGCVEHLAPELTFEKAFDQWIAAKVMRHATLISNAHYISERTEWDYRQYARALEKFFVGVKLCDMKDGMLNAYQHDRAFAEGAWEHQAGANRIRKEIGMLTRMLSDAGLWSVEREKGFQRVSAVESDIPRAMSPDEQNHFLTTAGRKEQWLFIYQYAIGNLQTCMATNEFRSLYIGDVALHQGVVQVRWASAKNRHRIRTIPLETEEVVWAFEGLIWRAKKLGASGPHHYLLPYGGRGGHSYDPTRHMSDTGIYKRWDEVRVAADLPWLRPYDLRHSAITRLAEKGTPIAVIMAFAGHISLRMQQHYTQISQMAMRKAVASTWSSSVPKPSWLSVEQQGSKPVNSLGA